MFVRVVVSVYARARVCVLQSIGCGDLVVLERLMAGCLLALPPPPTPRHFLLGSSRALPILGYKRGWGWFGRVQPEVIVVRYVLKTKHHPP